MNKKGFAISVILYSIVFLIITIFYIILGIIKTRYSVSSELRESIVNDLNSFKYIHGELDDNQNVNSITVNPNGGMVIFNGSVYTSSTSIVKYAGDSIFIPNATKNAVSEKVGTYTLSYDANGGNNKPDNKTVNANKITSYLFNRWDNTGQCGDFVSGVYTFPDTNGTTCTKKANWLVETNIDGEYVTLASAITRANYIFNGWKSSKDNQIYQPGTNYKVVDNTVMTAQWIAG